MIPIIKSGDVPQPAVKLSKRARYDWVALQPGDAIKFPPHVKPESARVMAARMARILGRRYRVFMAEDSRIYAQRIDGIREFGLLYSPDYPLAEVVDSVPEPMYEDEQVLVDEHVNYRGGPGVFERYGPGKAVEAEEGVDFDSVPVTHVDNLARGAAVPPEDPEEDENLI